MRAFLLYAFLAMASVSNASAADPVPLNDRAKAMDAEYALLFIHGILGSGGSAGRPGSFGSWPSIISNDNFELPDHGRLSEVAVYSLDYSASFHTHMDLEEVAIRVADDIGNSELFKRHRQVVVVAHSMGGLVVKRVLARWHSQTKDLLIGRIIGIGMLGVPAEGSPIVTLVKKYGVDRVARHFGWDTNFLTDLLPNSGNSFLDTIDNDWGTLQQLRDRRQQAPPPFDPFVSCGYETKNEIERGFWTGALAWTLSVFGWGDDIDSVDVVVPKIYAEKTWCDTRVALPVSHTDLASPKEVGDEQNRWLRQLFTDSVHNNLEWRSVSFGSGPPPNKLADPAAHNLHHIVDIMKSERESGTHDSTWLPRNPETVTISDQSAALAQTFVLTGDQFERSTLLYAWKEAAEKNKCLQVAPSGNRMSIELSIPGALKKCAGNAYVCEANSCD